MLLRKILFLFALVCSLSALGQTKNHSLTGTYVGTFSRYSKVTKGYITDTNYIRIKFINDSLFAFTLVGGTLTEHEFRFNYNPMGGIGRLVNDHERKIWVGLFDLGQGSGYFGRQDPTFYQVDSVLTIQQALDSIPPPYYPYNQYNLIGFSFKGQNKLSLTVIKKVAGRFELATEYAKADDKDLSFKIEPDFHEDLKTASYGDDSTVMANGSVLKILPVSENDRVVLNGQLKKDDKIYLHTRYMQYVFVYQLDSNGQISNYGWVKRSAVAPLKKE